MSELRLEKYTHETALRPSLRTTKTRANYQANPGPAILYVAYCQGFAKVGITGDVETRRRAMQCGCPYPISIIFKRLFARRVLAAEAEIKVMIALDEFHSKNDWFKCSRATVTYAAEKTLGESR